MADAGAAADRLGQLVRLAVGNGRHEHQFARVVADHDFLDGLAPQGGVELEPVRPALVLVGRAEGGAQVGVEISVVELATAEQGPAHGRLEGRWQRRGAGPGTGASQRQPVNGRGSDAHPAHAHAFDSQLRLAAICALAVVGKAS